MHSSIKENENIKIKADYRSPNTQLHLLGNFNFSKLSIEEQQLAITIANSIIQ